MTGTNRIAVLLFACAVARAVSPAQSAAAEATTSPATRPVSPEEAVYRSNVAMAEVLLAEPNDDALAALGRRHRAREDYARAAVIDLIVLRGHRDDPDVEYALACDFSLWGQEKLGMKYFQQAADHGYWGYRVVAEDTDVNALKNDPAFPAALAKVKDAFTIEAPKHAPGTTVALPAGDRPASGWPVLVFLHGWGSNRHDFDGAASFVATLGYVGVTVDANDVMGPAAYEWARTSVEPTHERIAAVLKALDVPIDSRRVYLQGFSQGAMHAARLLADHPDAYAGALCNSPGSPGLRPKVLADARHTGAMILSVGDHEAPNIGQSVNAIRLLWSSSGRPVSVEEFRGGHQVPSDFKSTLRGALAIFAATPR